MFAPGQALPGNAAAVMPCARKTTGNYRNSNTLLRSAPKTGPARPGRFARTTRKAEPARTKTNAVQRITSHYLRKVARLLQPAKTMTSTVTTIATLVNTAMTAIILLHKSFLI